MSIFNVFSGFGTDGDPNQEKFVRKLCFLPNISGFDVIFQESESPAPLNTPTPTPAPDPEWSRGLSEKNFKFVTET